MAYKDRIAKLLSPAELRLFHRLKTPQQVQDYLDRLPFNMSTSKYYSYKSPRRVLEAGKAHCAEGALLAAAILAFHGRKPLLMDMQAFEPDVDHVVALFREKGLWGAISKTNHPVVRYRDAVYPNVKTLALTFFHEYFLGNGTKTLKAYSAPFDLSKYPPETWVTARGDLQELMNELDDSRHFPIVPRKSIRGIRKASQFERNVTAAREWRRNGTKSYGR